MKIILILPIVLITVLSVSSANASPRKTKKKEITEIMMGGDAGNGGAGVKREGEYLTFGKAGIKFLKVEPMKRSEIPGFSEAKKGIKSLVLQNKYKYQLQKAISPSLNRKFYRATENTLSHEKKKQLLEIYRNLVKNESKSDFVIYALTDPEKEETYLMPEFFKIKDAKSQAAILFHEGVWMLSRHADYSFVVDLEIDFEEYLQVGSYNESLYMGLSELFKHKSIALKAAAEEDLRQGNLLGLVDINGEISNIDFFGQTFWENVINLISSESYFVSNDYYNKYVYKDCNVLIIPKNPQIACKSNSIYKSDGFVAHLLKLQDEYPDSNWLKLMNLWRDSFFVHQIHHDYKSAYYYKYILNSKFSITANTNDLPNPVYREYYGVVGNKPYYYYDPSWSSRRVINPDIIKLVFDN